MWTFFIILPILYLAGNIYIYLKGKQALKSQSTGVKVLLSIVFWGGALSFFSSFLFRNLDMPASFAQTVSQVGTGWLVFTLYMVLALLVFDILRLFHLRFKYSFYLSLFLTLSLLGYGNYNYQHPDTRVINMVINKPADTDGQPLKVVAISDIHLGYQQDDACRICGYDKRPTPGHRSYRWRLDRQQCRTSAIRAYGRGTVQDIRSIRRLYGTG